MKKWTKTSEELKKEREAIQFAMEILMPEAMVRKEVKRMGSIDLTDDAPIKILAKLFQVSQGLMAIRLGQIYGKLLE